MAERGSAFNDFSCIDSSYIYAQEIEKAFFFPEDAVYVPRNEEDATKCCNAGTCSTHRATPCPGQGTGESSGTVGMVNQNN